ncbi:unnamed protein product [Schistosoma curassoni]|uniref:Ovule protein n=1 Tax=Schistosoma curassoni TaxID=6186 RepID=A0A183JGH9_9TREM|nr:unnamed protein product [Schistosoma curassoni]
MYPDDLRSFCIRVGFLLTNIVSIPLIIFPLRQTVYNLLCQKVKIPLSIGDAYYLYLSTSAAHTTVYVRMSVYALTVLVSTFYLCN